MTEGSLQLQPLYLLADSQLLFWERRGRLLLEAAVDGLARDTPLSAAYIGASNGDRPEFYGIFEAAVDAVGITDRRMIDSSFGPDDRAFLERAKLIVLAGGDVRLGWNTFEKTGMKDVILRRYAESCCSGGYFSRRSPARTLRNRRDARIPRTRNAGRVQPRARRRRHSRRAIRVGAVVARDQCSGRSRHRTRNPFRWRSHRARRCHFRATPAPAHEFRFRGLTCHALTVGRRRP